MMAASLPLLLFGIFMAFLFQSVSANVLPDSHKNTSNVLIVTAISPKRCRGVDSDFLMLLSKNNKADYARIHNYDVLWSQEQVSPKLRGAWNKVATVHNLLLTTAYEWIVWMDYDVLIYDLNFAIPFKKYAEDFILWGLEKELYFDGDAHMGLNTGVFYVRNTPWSRELLARVGAIGEAWFEEKQKGARILQLNNYTWNPRFENQNGFTYVLKTWPEAGIKTRLERDYTMNGYWKSWQAPGQEQQGEDKMFIIHYSGCQFCSGINKAESDTCIEHFVAIAQSHGLGPNISFPVI